MTGGRLLMRTRSRTRWTWRCSSGSRSTGGRSGPWRTLGVGRGGPGVGWRGVGWGRSTGSTSRRGGVGEIDGVDLSPGMLEVARARGVYRSLGEAEVADTGLDASTYDLVIACLVDEHLADLRPLYAEAARLAAPGGRFALIGFHPHFIIASGMPTHFDDAESGEPVAIETHVHLLSDHVAAGLGAGLTLVALHERVVDDEFVALKPKWERFRGHPISFAFVWRTP
ncbi:MAG TPA: class I SAM-dependent methyltransferase [Solirubrobacterales bacterium]|nr:class I SAM-dependent methyltransferase [Solirubrobacterales bacterium]